MATLMDQARARRSQKQDGQLKAPDYREFTPPEILDEVERIVAAGMKLMYAPEMSDERMAAVQSKDPVDQTLADNVVGLLLTLDQQAQGGLPVATLFPAAMGLLGEAAQVLQAAGKAVTQDDFNDAAVRMFAVIGKKLGGSDEQIMQAAEQAMGGGAGMPQREAEDRMETGEPPEGTPADMREDVAEGEAPETEEQAMARGMAQ